MGSWPKASEDELRRRRAAGRLVIEAMQELHLTQTELGQRMGVSRQTVNSGLREGTWTLEKITEAADAAGFRLVTEHHFSLYSAQGGWLAETKVVSRFSDSE